MDRKKKKDDIAMGKKRALSERVTDWVGTPASVVAHTACFISVFGLYFVGYSIESIFLGLTTILSLEAIYLALFIQMTVNRHQTRLKDVESDIDEILEDTESLTLEELKKVKTQIHKKL